ncbi:carbohydrate ABC transporter substrate-binding protein [Rhodophyticola sp. CCM32]|uniref:ABC transporter substrate-binding protein n=1 Tax=Rhodophyticola sp. CCM32 TaxID=2916397 RepID=UPI00107F9FF9|nr:ABC transporter substrate-binding protein [Rhodophyticola sp. CCM32]QBY01226.1 carbohydrate ABC transporter substrate-binding protein [Rhodophyticola sp. CCM32]
MHGLFKAAMTTAIIATSSTSFAQSYDPDRVQGEITFYTHFGNLVDSGDWQRWADEFAEAFPGASVDVVPVSEYRREMGVRIATGDYGDVLNVLDSLPPADYHQFYAPIVGSTLEDDYQFVDRYTVDGDIYGYVYGVVAEAIIYNRTSFERAGIEEIPTTLTEFMEVCSQLQDAGITPMSINMGAGWPMQQWEKVPLMLTGDGAFYETMLSDPAPFNADRPFGQSIALLRQLFEAGCTEPDYTADNWANSRTLTAAGESAMMFFGNWAVPQIAAAGDVIGVDAYDDLGMFPFPVDDSGVLSVMVGPDWALGVASNSDNPDTANAWIEFLFSSTDVAETAGFIPGPVSATHDIAAVNELYGYEPRLVFQETPSSEFKQAMADARFDFQYGAYIRDVILADDYDAAIADLNARWAAATGQ